VLNGHAVAFGTRLTVGQFKKVTSGNEKKIKREFFSIHPFIFIKSTKYGFKGTSSCIYLKLGGIQLII